MPSFDEILNNRKSNQFYAAATPNVVAVFDNGSQQITFAKHDPDTGLVVDDRHLIVDGYKTPSLKINHENASTSFPSTSLDLISIKGELFNLLSVDDDLFTGKECRVFLGFINAGMDFEDFVFWLCSEEGGDDRADRHWISQSRLLEGADGDLLCDFVGKYENLIADLARISELASIPVVELPAPGPSTDYRKYYTKKTSAMIADRYQQDIERFEYSF